MEVGLVGTFRKHLEMTNIENFQMKLKLLEIYRYIHLTLPVLQNGGLKLFTLHLQSLGSIGLVFQLFGVILQEGRWAKINYCIRLQMNNTHIHIYKDGIYVHEIYIYIYIYISFGYIHLLC